MPEVIQGKWEDLITRQDLRGRQVRIIVLDEQSADDPWLKSLRAWARQSSADSALDRC